MENFLGKADLHLHSKASNQPWDWFSGLINCPESFAEPLEIYKRLKKRGMTFVTITDHDTIDGVLEIAHFDDVFISCEYTVYIPEENGKVHILVYGLEENEHRDLLELKDSVYQFVRYLKLRNLAHSLAHPLYSVQGTKITKRFVEKLILLFDCWEAINGTRSNGITSIEMAVSSKYDKWDKIYRLAEKYKIEPLRTREKISYTAGSDDHGGLDVGRTWTGVEGASTKAEFLRGVLRGNTKLWSDEGEDGRLLNLVCKVAHDYLESKGWIPKEISAITESLFKGSNNKMNIGLISGLLGTEKTSENYLKEIAKNLPYFMIKRFLDHPSPKTFGESSLSFIGHVLPALIKFLQKREEQKIINLGMELEVYKEKPAKVAYLTDTYHHINGVSRTAQIIRELAKEKKFPLVILVSNSKVSNDDNLISLNPLFEIPTPFYQEMKMGLPNLLQLVEILEKEQFTHVHLATPGPLGILGLMAAKILGLHVTFAFHTDIPTYARTYTGSPWVEEMLWKGFVWLANLSDRLFVPSEHFKMVFSNLGVESWKISIFKRGVDTTLFCPTKADPSFWPTKLNTRDHERVILYVGRVSKEKGLDAFLYAATCFPKEAFVIVGDGPYRKELEKKRPNNLYTVGYLTGEELAKAYASSDIFLFPSETETYGLAILEAMASGLPVIVSSKGASSEHIRDGINGFIVSKPIGYVHKISLLLSSQEFRRKVAQGALHYARRLDLKKTHLEYMTEIASVGGIFYETPWHHSIFSSKKRGYKKVYQ